MSHTDNEGSGAHPDGYPIMINGIPGSNEGSAFENDEKSFYVKIDVEAASNPPVDDASDVVLHSEREIATHVISVDDDPSLNPWTFRAFFLGIGLSAFGGSLGMFVSLLVISSISYTKQPRSITSNR